MARSANMMMREVALDLDSMPNSVGHPFCDAPDKLISATPPRRRWHRKRRNPRT
jgi:dimethylamine/trimethylamine dehydrogenase